MCNFIQILKFIMIYRSNPMRLMVLINDFNIIKILYMQDLQKCRTPRCDGVGKVIDLETLSHT